MSASTEDQSTASKTAPPTYDTVTSPPTKYQITILDKRSRSEIFSKMDSHTNIDTDTGSGTGRVATISHLHSYPSRDRSDPQKLDQYIQLTEVSDVCPVEVRVADPHTPNEDQLTDSDGSSSKMMRGSRNQIDLVVPFNFHPESGDPNADGDADGSRESSIFDSFVLTGLTNSIKDVKELDEWKDRARFDLITNQDMTNSESIPMVLGDMLNGVKITGLNLDLYKGEEKVKSLDNLDARVNGMTFFCGKISEGSLDHIIGETEGGTGKIPTEATQNDRDGITKDLDKLSVSK
ncbi:hypothetical protein I204_04242 [Kwoniella mangroviensis CBS 8886]|nr:hypothetical protein I204_04242 [Kwoniella mangroviensis CBS 8886]